MSMAVSWQGETSDLLIMKQIGRSYLKVLKVTTVQLRFKRTKKQETVHRLLSENSDKKTIH